MPVKILAVVGPTASGKTALAIALARALDGEIVLMDSMQIYRGMEIGTAAPTAEEEAAVPHHLAGFLSPSAEFSCAEYVTHAAACIAEITSRGKLPILCGGTGLYLDSLLRVERFSDPEPSPDLRETLLREAEENGSEALHERLRAVDPEAADAIHPNNVRRVIRALEIYLASGVPKSEWDRRSLAAAPRYDAGVIVLDYRDRQRLYDRIDRRVTLMLDAGLEAEARALLAAGYLSGNTSAAQAIGYKELLPYFAGESTLAEAADQIRLASRRYAKRQLTWFRRYRDAIWLYPDADGDTLRSPDALTEQASAALRARGWMQ